MITIYDCNCLRIRKPHVSLYVCCSLGKKTCLLSNRLSLLHCKVNIVRAKVTPLSLLSVRSMEQHSFVLPWRKELTVIKVMPGHQFHEIPSLAKKKMAASRDFIAENCRGEICLLSRAQIALKDEIAVVLLMRSAMHSQCQCQK